MNDRIVSQDADFLYVTTRDIGPLVLTCSSAEISVALIIMGVCRLLTTRADAAHEIPPFLIKSSGIPYQTSWHPKMALDRALENSTMAQFVHMSQQRLQSVYRLINLMYWHSGHQQYRDDFYQLPCTHQDMVDNTASYQRVYKLTKDYITPPGGGKLKLTEVERRVDSNGLFTSKAVPELDLNATRNATIGADDLSQISTDSDDVGDSDEVQIEVASSKKKNESRCVVQ